GELVTASKAIIEKEYQPRVVMSTTGPNPFHKLTDQELEEYRQEVERKQRQSEEDCEDGRQQGDRSSPDQTIASTPPSTPVKLEEGTCVARFASEALRFHPHFFQRRWS
ncbi:alpha-adducin-like, partial [Notechis scutatus]|uniref:Alpha-adducin-like n=1 Tax=Notechis scutatus TaxID=8663 RepID=A0A6J1WAU4_9SAUR